MYIYICFTGRRVVVGFWRAFARVAAGLVGATWVCEHCWYDMLRSKIYLLCINTKTVLNSKFYQFNYSPIGLLNVFHCIFLPVVFQFDI